MYRSRETYAMTSMCSHIGSVSYSSFVPYHESAFEPVSLAPFCYSPDMPDSHSSTDPNQNSSYTHRAQVQPSYALVREWFFKGSPRLAEPITNSGTASPSCALDASAESNTGQKASQSNAPRPYQGGVWLYSTGHYYGMVESCEWLRHTLIAALNLGTYFIKPELATKHFATSTALRIQDLEGVRSRSKSKRLEQEARAFPEEHGNNAIPKRSSHFFCMTEKGNINVNVDVGIPSDSERQQKWRVTNITTSKGSTIKYVPAEEGSRATWFSNANAASIVQRDAGDAGMEQRYSIDDKTNSRVRLLLVNHGRDIRFNLVSHYASFS